MMPANLKAENTFKLSPVAYFNIIDDSHNQKKTLLLDWSQPNVEADGKITTYQPPLVVINLLNDPTPENAKSYVMWQQAKMQRIQLAQEAVAALREDIPQ